MLRRRVFFLVVLSGSVSSGGAGAILSSTHFLDIYLEATLFLWIGCSDYLEILLRSSLPEEAGPEFLSAVPQMVVHFLWEPGYSGPGEMIKSAGGVTSGAPAPCPTRQDAHPGTPKM